MIDECEYRLPGSDKQQPKPVADPATLDYLEALPFRPHGVEW
jgi:hypothetical protein